MATKYYCDGCDKEVPYDDVQLVDVDLKFRVPAVSTSGTYELCKGCAASLTQQANPKRWVRSPQLMPA